MNPANYLMTSVGSVIQVKETVPAWGGCLMIVEEVKKWGVTALMRIPGREMKTTFLRLNHSEYYYIGESKIVVEDKNE